MTIDLRDADRYAHERWAAPWRRSAAARPGGQGLPTLVVGAGAAARTLIRDLRECPDFGLRPIGCLDDNPHARSASGVPVLGTLSDLGRVVTARGVRAVVIAIPSLPRDETSALIRRASELGVHVRLLPSFLSAVERVARAADMRSLRLTSLLGREERQVAQPAVSEILRGARVLVTGAGGSIGQELCRQVRSHGPASLQLLDHDESNLHGAQLELHGEALLDSDEVIVADIRDAARIRQVFRSVRPDVVFHAAAHKHLPLLERYPCEGVKTNVLGTQNLVQAALEVDTGRFVLISTDKAADPSSVLGATKRLAEMVVQSNAIRQTRFCSVRFGNVLGSRGSFLAALADQIERGVPVTVTHPEVTRFLMTVEEAVGLVLSAAPMGEYGETFVLDMGQPVRIVDVVRNYAEAVHLDHVQIRYTGLRPGEKLHEVLFSDAEQRLPTAHPAISATHPRPLPDDFAGALEELYATAAADDSDAVRTLLSQLVAEYVPAEASPMELAIASAAPYPDEL